MAVDDDQRRRRRRRRLSSVDVFVLLRFFVRFLRVVVVCVCVCVCVSLCAQRKNPIVYDLLQRKKTLLGDDRETLSERISNTTTRDDVDQKDQKELLRHPRGGPDGVGPGDEDGVPAPRARVPPGQTKPATFSSAKPNANTRRKRRKRRKSRG